MSGATPGAPQWSNPWALTAHFQLHGAGLGTATVHDDERSALDTIRVGRRFSYVDRASGAPRIGYFDPANDRFVALRADERIIYSHFRPSRAERNVRRLPQSTYR